MTRYHLHFSRTIECDGDLIAMKLLEAVSNAADRVANQFVSLNDVRFVTPEFNGRLEKATEQYRAGGDVEFG